MTVGRAIATGRTRPDKMNSRSNNLDILRPYFEYFVKPISVQRLARKERKEKEKGKGKTPFYDISRPATISWMAR